MKKTTQSLLILTVIIGAALGFVGKSYAGGDKYFSDKYYVDPSVGLAHVPTCEEARREQLRVLGDQEVRIQELECRVSCHEQDFESYIDLNDCLVRCYQVSHARNYKS